MRISKKRVGQIIKEEMAYALNEVDADEGWAAARANPGETSDHDVWAGASDHVVTPADVEDKVEEMLNNLAAPLGGTAEDFKLILTETQNSLIKQYVGLLGTEKVELIFENDGIDKLAELATEINENIENIGARRLHTIMEKVLEDISYSASDTGPQTIHINKKFVEENLEELILQLRNDVFKVLNDHRILAQFI